MYSHTDVTNDDDIEMVGNLWVRPIENGLLIIQTSPLTGKDHEMFMDITREQLTEYATTDRLIQDIFPDLTADEREFLMTGITPSEWDQMFGEEDD